MKPHSAQRVSNQQRIRENIFPGCLHVNSEASLVSCVGKVYV